MQRQRASAYLINKQRDGDRNEKQKKFQEICFHSSEWWESDLLSLLQFCLWQESLHGCICFRQEISTKALFGRGIVYGLIFVLSMIGIFVTGYEDDTMKYIGHCYRGGICWLRSAFILRNFRCWLHLINFRDSTFIMDCNSSFMYYWQQCLPWYRYWSSPEFATSSWIYLIW